MSGIFAYQRKLRLKAIILNSRKNGRHHEFDFWVRIQIFLGFAPALIIVGFEFSEIVKVSEGFMIAALVVGALWFTFVMYSVFSVLFEANRKHKQLFSSAGHHCDWQSFREYWQQDRAKKRAANV